jgi:glutamine cyclotransferase
LTWQANLGYVYDRESFELIEEFNYPTEGWGITHDGNRLIMSDGSSYLYFLDPETFEEIGRVAVTDNGIPITLLNELEYVHGEIYANVWLTDRIARIMPQTGQVKGWIDLKGILSNEGGGEQEGVLNGIAYDAENERLFVTGKLWPKLFEIELIPVE